MKTSNNLLFTGLKIIAWILFISLCIESGALIVNFLLSIYNPEMVGNLYSTIDLSKIYLSNQWAFFQIYSFVLIISLLKTYLFYVVVILVTKLDLGKPFNSFVSHQISKISYYTFSIGILSYIARQSCKKLEIKGLNLESVQGFWGDAQAFILMAAVIYIISVIFKKGVELQNENDLTI